jgi:AcrR family transcriptional regulator
VTGSHNARERLVEAAVGLLRRSGARSVSMDAASAAAGAGKMSAYRHFTSKDDLLAAALERYNPRHVGWLSGAGARETGGAAESGVGGVGGVGGYAGPDPREPARRILSAFDRLESAAGGENFRGCPFVDAALSAPGPDRRIAAIAGRHKQDLAQALAGLAAQAGMHEPEEVGAAVALVIDGAAAQAAVASDPAARRRIVRRGRRIAQTLLAAAGPR